MKTKGRKMLRRFAGILLGAAAFGLAQLTAIAGNTDSLRAHNAGAAVILDGDLTSKEKKGSFVETAAFGRAEKDGEEETDAAGEDDPEESSLVMSNVQNAVNVRKEADEDSDKVGLLYTDCGGEILERRNGWTKLKSGNVTGWTKDEYLLFGEEAQELAMSVGNLVATVEADALRVRQEPKENAAVCGLLGKYEELEALDVTGDGWISVEYEGEVGYISSKYTDVRFLIDYGETVEEISAREKKQQEEKRKAAEAKLKENRGAVAVEAADDVLLGALIQCEAGNQPYEGQLAVGAVVMNRVRSGGYPNTVSGVIYASGQFTPALNGRLAKRVASGVSPACIQAAQEAIAGASNVGGATHFRRAGNHDGVVIGSHVFW